MFVGSVVSHLLLRLCSFFFIPFSFCASDWRNLVDLCSSLLILPSVYSHLLLSSSHEFFTSLILFNCKISICLFYNFCLFINILYLLRHFQHTSFSSLSIVCGGFLNVFIMADFKFCLLNLTSGPSHWQFLLPPFNCCA